MNPNQDETYAPLLRTPGAPIDVWLETIARCLLFETDFMIAGAPHRIREVEFYYHASGHEDPFTHGEALQKTWGRWYFHRVSGGYRGGSFRGLDVTFGPEGEVGGILIRTIESPDGSIINGCSLCVDHMLKRTSHETVAALDASLGAAHIWEEGPLRLAPRERARDGVLYSSARVGLTLKRLETHPTMPAYLMRRYRFFDDPTIRKGRLHTIIALHQDGASVEEIRAQTGSRAATIERYIGHHQAGTSLRDPQRWSGRALSSEDLCTLHGLWYAMYA